MMLKIAFTMTILVLSALGCRKAEISIDRRPAEKSIALSQSGEDATASVQKLNLAPDSYFLPKTSELDAALIALMLNGRMCSNFSASGTMDQAWAILKEYNLEVEYAGIGTNRPSGALALTGDPNLEVAMLISADPDVRQALTRASLDDAIGTPLVWDDVEGRWRSSILLSGNPRYGVTTGDIDQILRILKHEAGSSARDVRILPSLDLRRFVGSNPISFDEFNQRFDEYFSKIGTSLVEILPLMDDGHAMMITIDHSKQAVTMFEPNGFGAHYIERKKHTERVWEKLRNHPNMRSYAFEANGYKKGAGPQQTDWYDRNGVSLDNGNCGIYGCILAEEILNGRSPASISADPTVADWNPYKKKIEYHALMTQYLERATEAHLREYWFDKLVPDLERLRENGYLKV